MHDVLLGKGEPCGLCGTLEIRVRLWLRPSLLGEQRKIVQPQISV